VIYFYEELSHSTGVPLSTQKTPEKSILPNLPNSFFLLNGLWQESFSYCGGLLFEDEIQNSISISKVSCLYLRGLGFEKG
jgi:hypothetical protein